MDLGQKVAIVISGECGQVVGKAQYLSSDDVYSARYLVRYQAADGRAVEAWWPLVELRAIE